MAKGNRAYDLAGVTAATLIGILLFFVIIGVFGLQRHRWPRGICLQCCSCLPRFSGRWCASMTLDPSILARIQFAFTVSFHIIFPTMSIGLASFLALIEALWLKTKDPLYLQIYQPSRPAHSRLRLGTARQTI
jgi:Cytochrome bd terminal oxidase subunit I